MTRYANIAELVADGARGFGPEDDGHRTIPALTLTQPWATLVMLGEKRIETRHCLFGYRGPLAIHASREIDGDAIRTQECRAALDRHDVPNDDSGLVTRAVLGIVDVVDGCRFDGMPFPWCIPIQWRDKVAEFEAAFGDYRRKRGGLLLANPTWLATPDPCRGLFGLWPYSFEAPLEFRP